MKIKGVISTARNGKKKGDPIEFDHREKTPLAIKDIIPKQAPEGEMWWVERVDVKKENWIPADLKTKSKGFSSFQYNSSGEVVIRRMATKTDKLYRPMVKKFSIEFEDCLDDMGMPDIKISKVELV
jgi:hypothetical protein